MQKNYTLLLIVLCSIPVSLRTFPRAGSISWIHSWVIRQGSPEIDNAFTKRAKENPNAIAPWPLDIDARTRVCVPVRLSRGTSAT